jgi:hypothetical protein
VVPATISHHVAVLSFSLATNAIVAALAATVTAVSRPAPRGLSTCQPSTPIQM